MLRRLATSRWVKLGLLAVALGFCGYGLATQRAEVAAALQHLVWGSVVGAALAAIAGLGCLMLAWRTVVADLGSHLPLRPATRVMFISQLGKYVPGAVWVTAAQVELGREHLVPRQRSATASILAMLITLATGLLGGRRWSASSAWPGWPRRLPGRCWVGVSSACTPGCWWPI